MLFVAEFVTVRTLCRRL